MQITKFKISKNGKIGVAFKILLRTIGDKEIWTKAAIASDEPIQQNLADILVKLRSYVVGLLELPAKEEHRIEVIGAEFTETEKEGIFGAQIYALRKLDHSNIPQEVTTPHKTETPYADSRGTSGPEPEQILDAECVGLLRLLQQEAIQYIYGQEDQLGLFNRVPDPELPALTDQELKNRKTKKSKKAL